MGRFARASEAYSTSRALTLGALLLTCLLGLALISGTGAIQRHRQAAYATAVSPHSRAATASSTAAATSTEAQQGAHGIAVVAGGNGSVAAGAGAAGVAQVVDAARTLQGELQVRPDPDFVTFIIPSRGRETLGLTLESLFNQTMPASWRALVLLDGTPDKPLPKAALEDPRVRLVALEKRLGTENHSGGVRNLAIKLASTPWVAMVDDDDTVHSQYVERLLWEVQHEPKAETVVFRMWMWQRNGSYPDPGTRRVKIGIGISFALRRATCLQGFWFVPGTTEDGELLERIQAARRPIVISPYVNYYVKGLPGDVWDAQLGRWTGPASAQEHWSKMDRFLVE